MSENEIPHQMLPDCPHCREIVEETRNLEIVGEREKANPQGMEIRTPQSPRAINGMVPSPTYYYQYPDPEKGFAGITWMERAEYVEKTWRKNYEDEYTKTDKLRQDLESIKTAHKAEKEALLQENESVKKSLLAKDEIIKFLERDKVPALESKVRELEHELEAVKSLMQDGERAFYEKWKGAEKEIAELEGELETAGRLLRDINSGYPNLEMLEVQSMEKWLRQWALVGLSMPHIKRLTEGKK